MARWKLTEKHYLNVEGIEWEQVEQHIETGEQVRHRHHVPLYLDPDDAGILKRWGQGGTLIVSNGGDHQPRDIIFSGPPTPAMEPLDDEAQEQTAQARPGWQHPIETLPGQGFNDNLLEQLSKALVSATDKMGKTQNAPIGLGVDPVEFARLQEQVAALMERNAQLESTSHRRV